MYAGAPSFQASVGSRLIFHVCGARKWRPGETTSASRPDWARHQRNMNRAPSGAGPSAARCRVVQKLISGSARHRVFPWDTKRWIAGSCSSGGGAGDWGRAQRALTTRARMMRATDARKTSMPVPLLDAKAAPEGAALWLEMIREQGRAYNPSPPFRPASRAVDKHNRVRECGWRQKRWNIRSVMIVYVSDDIDAPRKPRLAPGGGRQRGVQQKRRLR